MRGSKRVRRLTAVLLTVVLAIAAIIPSLNLTPPEMSPSSDTRQPSKEKSIFAKDILNQLEVKGRAPKTDYRRAQFGQGWAKTDGCDTRNTILYRDLTDVVLGDDCKVVSGVLLDPYTNVKIMFQRGDVTSDDVQIDHVVALSNAWQTGAQQLTLLERSSLANDPLNLLAVDGSANQQKSDGDAATWLPSFKPFRCQYVARQVAVKHKYHLWVTAPEKEAIERVLDSCPMQPVPSIGASKR